MVPAVEKIIRIISARSIAQQQQQLYSTAGREAKDMSGRKISD
jgi:hypothetical protein